jgi:hypothetical protein
MEWDSNWRYEMEQIRKRRTVRSYYNSGERVYYDPELCKEFRAWYQNSQFTSKEVRQMFIPDRAGNKPSRNGVLNWLRRSNPTVGVLVRDSILNILGKETPIEKPEVFSIDHTLTHKTPKFSEPNGSNLLQEIRLLHQQVRYVSSQLNYITEPLLNSVKLLIDKGKHTEKITHQEAFDPMFIPEIDGIPY